MPKSVPATFADLLRAQCGVFTLAQAELHGVTPDQVRADVAASRVVAMGRGVYVAFTGPLHDRHRAWVALLTAGGDAAISHESAAHRHGLLPDAPASVHVLVAHDATPDRRRGVVIHRTRSYARRTVEGTPPTTSVADTICDLAASGWSTRRLAGLVTTAVQRRLTDGAKLQAAMKIRGPFPGVAGLRELAHDTAAGAESVLELRFLRDVERAHGLPAGTRQAKVRRRDGSIAIRDVYYAQFRVGVELDGSEHHAPMRARLADARRDRLAGEEDELTLRYGWLDVAEAACLAAREVAQVLIDRGWRGIFQTCQSCERLPGPEHR